MAANWELQLLASILTADDRAEAYRSVVAAGVGLKHFGGMDAKGVWSHIDTYYKRPRDPGRIPSQDAIQETFKNLDLPRPVEALTDLIGKVSGGHTMRAVERALDAYESEASIDDAVTALTSLLTELNQVQETNSSKNDVRWRDVALDEIREDLTNISNNDGVTGLPYPWPVMNEHTGGIQPGDFIVLWALPKSKKTWIGLYMAVHLFMLGYRVLIYSKEMSWKNIRRRVSCIISGVDYARFKRGELTESELARVMRAAEVTTSDLYRGELLFTDCDKPDGSIGGAAEIREKVDKYRADIVFADSTYMLQEPGVKDAVDWKAIDAIIRALKQVAKTTLVPIIGIMQENEKAALKYKGKSRGTASIGMYSGMVAHLDVGIRIVNNERENKTSLIFAACREVQFPGFTINTKLCEDFSHDPHAPLYEIGDGIDDDVDTQAADAVDARRDQARAEFSTTSTNRYARRAAEDPEEDEEVEEVIEAGDEMSADLENTVHDLENTTHDTEGEPDEEE